jgi:uncharacterized membrane protein
MTDQKLESIVANLLRTGVTIAAVVVLIGGIGYLAQHGQEQPGYRDFRPADWHDWKEFRDWRAVIQFGLLLLIATPIARVVFALVAFAMEKDRLYVIITSIVLVVLLYSLAAPH